MTSWTPFETFSNEKTFIDWMRLNRDPGGALQNVESGQAVVVLQEANMADEYWRIFWPKDNEKPENHWFQYVASVPDGIDINRLKKGDRLTINKIEFIVSDRKKEPYVVNLVRV